MWFCGPAPAAAAWAEEAARSAWDQRQMMQRTMATMMTRATSGSEITSTSCIVSTLRPCTAKRPTWVPKRGDNIIINKIALHHSHTNRAAILSCVELEVDSSSRWPSENTTTGTVFHTSDDSTRLHCLGNTVAYVVCCLLGSAQK